MRLPKDLLTETYTRPSLYLCETDKTIICELDTIEMNGSFKFNAYSELTFTVPRTYINMITGETDTNPFYNKIEALRLIYLEGFGYFEIQEPEIISDGIREVKNVTAYSLEYTLSQKYLEGIYINTGDINSAEVIANVTDSDGKLIPITLYNTGNKKLSLLHIILEKVYGWKIGHVDSSLTTMSRQFEISRVSVYDFIVQEICDKFNCIAVFDTENNTINLYAEALVTKFRGDGTTKEFKLYNPYYTIDSVTIDGYKTTAYKYHYMVDEYTNAATGVLVLDNAPESGATIEVTDGTQAQWTTDVYVSFDNLAKEVSIGYSADDIKTVLTVKGANDLDIREVNMGLPYLVDLSWYYNVDWMGEELYRVYTLYMKEYGNDQQEYQKNSERMIVLNDRIGHEQSRVSLQYSVADYVSRDTVGKYYVRGGTHPNYYYTEVTLPADWKADTTYYELSGTDLDQTKFANLYTALIKYYESESSKDVSEIEKYKEDFKFIESYFNNLVSSLSSASSITQKDNAVNAFLDEMWNQLGLFALETYHKTYEESWKKVSEEAGHDDPSNKNYWTYHVADLVVKSLKVEKDNEIIDGEIKERKDTIKVYQDEYDKYVSRNKEIANNLSLDVFFTNHYKKEGLSDVEAQRKALSLMIRLSPFLREDEYTDDNFIETSVDTTETIMRTKKELMECGYIELRKLSSPKLAFSMDMANIYALPEFEPIIDQFQLGNLINVVVRSDFIKRARLLGVNINFDDFSDFTCEFGELTNLKTPSSIHADLLANALSAGKSVASNASYWQKGADMVTDLELRIEQGLSNAVQAIKNNDGTQHVTTSEYGIRLQKYDDNGILNPKEGWIVNNQFLYSDDNFKTVKSVFGEYEIDGETKWGLLADSVMAGYVAGCTIEGGTINIGDGTFVVDSGGHVTMKASSIDGYVEKNGVISSINQSSEKVVINANKISLAGKQIDLTSDNITIDSTNFSVTKDGAITAANADISGKITSTSGEIGGWTIYDGLLRKEITIDDVEYQMYLQAADGVNTTNAFAVRKRNPDVSSWDVQFAVNYAGKMTAKNADITGTITATDGSIAGYNIGSGGSYDNAIYKRVAGDGTGVDYEVGLKATSGDTDLAFYVKQSADDWASNSNVFYVRNNGQLYAKNADISGKITASSGKIGSWNVGDMGNYTNSIYSTFCAAESPSSSNPEYAVFMRGSGSSASTIAIGVKKRTSSSTSWGDAEETFYVLKNGHTMMADADVTGKINASSGNISGNLNISGALINTRGNYTVTLRGVQSDVSHGVFYITDNSSGTAEYPVRINGDGSARFTNVTITGNSTIASACIPNLSADKITAGTINADRIPNISASKITSGTISTDRLSSSVITTSNFSSKSLTTGNLTVSGGSKLGYWTVTSSGGLTCGSGTSSVGLSSSGVSHGSGWTATWYDIIQAGNGASDERLKHDISEFEDCYDNVFDNLKPVKFRYNIDPDRLRMGFIAQDVKADFETEGINDFGGVYVGEGDDDYYRLLKEDFIALNTWQIQKLKARVEELETKLASLET